jgi:hypothetical protein
MLKAPTNRPFVGVWDGDSQLANHTFMEEEAPQEQLVFDSSIQDLMGQVADGDAGVSWRRWTIHRRRSEDKHGIFKSTQSVKMAREAFQQLRWKGQLRYA